MKTAMSVRNFTKIVPASARAKIGRAIRNFRRKQKPELGLDFVREIKFRLPFYKVKTIFDVGAHLGITALEFSDNFPFATVYAFEPGVDNMRKLEINLVGAPKVRRYQIALGANQGIGRLLIDPNHPSTNRLTQTDGGLLETVTINTIDKFCAEQGIELIDILKIDVEGAELGVLSGALSSLASGNIGLVKAECAVDPDCNYHTSFGESVTCCIHLATGYLESTTRRKTCCCLFQNDRPA